MSNKLLNSFASTNVAKLYLQSDSADIHFVFPSVESAPSVKVPAHKLLLATASPVFKAMFNGNWNENETVDITDSAAEAFKEFLQFFYLPEVTLTIGNIEEVVRLADKYDMLDCFEMCAEFLEANLTTENMVWGYQLAIILNNAPLLEFCEKHVQVHTKEILGSEMFLQCSREVIDYILKLDTLECDEIEVFRACIEWAKASCQKNGLDENKADDLKNQLGSCFYSIRFGAMSGEEIGNILMNKVIDDMFTKDELADIWRTKWTKEFQSELFNRQPRLKPSYAWDATNKLICNRTVSTNQTRCNIQQQESTWFSTNELVLLGEVFFAAVQTYNGGYRTLYFDINILEHGADNFAVDAPIKQLYENINIPSGSTFSLLKPIAIRPNKLYEIRLLPRSGNGNYSHALSWGDSEIKLNDKITIKFHQNPLENSSGRRGLVSALHFNQIQ